MNKTWRWLKIVLAIIVLMIVLSWIGLQMVDESLPLGQQGPEAEMLADKMLEAVNQQAWDTTGAISWFFRGGHEHLWDKERHYARVKWDDHEVLIDINARKGWVVGGDQATDQEKSELCLQAWKFWANDSFWLNPVVKVRDPGTSRSVVSIGEEKGLLITYSSGGVTPGDSYLWLMDEDGMPNRWKMWVQILPIGGLAFTWEDWITTKTGAKVARLHQGLIDVTVTEVEAAYSLAELIPGEDVFAPLENQSGLVEF